jgi:hypothetical protein
MDNIESSTTAPRKDTFEKKDRTYYYEEKLKEQLGDLLFALQNPFLDENQRRKLWRSFERKLRRYVDHRFCR